MKDDNIIGWFSLENGAHVPLKKGEGKAEATKKFLSNKTSRVEKNKSKYDKIDDFKKRKATNLPKKEEDEDIEYLDLDEEKEEPARKNPNAKIKRFDKRGNTYIPIREGEEEQYEKELENERDNFYERYAKFYGSEKEGRGRSDGEFVALANEEMKKELREKLDPIYEDKGVVSKEDVKKVVEDFKKRKLSNRQNVSFTGTDEQIMKQEKYYLDKEIKDMDDATSFSVRPEENARENYLMSERKMMTSQERERYNNLVERRNEILRKMYKNRNK